MKKNQAGWWQAEIEASIATYHDEWGSREARAYGQEVRDLFASILRLDPSTPVPRDWPEAQEALRWIAADAFGDEQD